MKNALLSIIMLLSFTAFSQVTDLSNSPYLVGHPTLKDFPLQVMTNTSGSLVKLENGKTCLPALNKYIKYTKNYVGGYLINEVTNDTTTITNIKFDCTNQENCFWIYGTDFNNNFNLNNGFILYEGTRQSIFYNSDTGDRFSINKVTP